MDSFFSNFHLLQQGFHHRCFPVNFGNFSGQPFYRISVNSCFSTSSRKSLRLNIQDPRTICKVLRKFSTKSRKWRHPFVALLLVSNKIRHPWEYTKSEHTCHSGRQMNVIYKSDLTRLSIPVSLLLTCNIMGRLQFLRTVQSSSSTCSVL